jgi:hypothetical protein
MMIIPAMLLGIVVALLRRPPHAVLDGQTQDVPMRLLWWTAGLLPAPRDEWGQAMLGELDHIEGRARRWRFTIGCLGATLLLPPPGRAGAGVLAMVTVATASLGLYASVVIRYGLGAGAWVWAAIALAFLLGFIVAAVVLLRRPGVAVPGLLGGLFVAVAWLVMSGFTFFSFLAPLHPGWAILLLLIVVPAAVGAIGTLWGGSAVVGRRTARLAAVSAGLAVFLYGTLAVAVLGAGGPPSDAGWTVRYIVGDRLGNNIVFYLVLLPLATATMGWAAAAATARIRPRPAANADRAPVTTGGRVEPVARPEAVGSAVPARIERRTVRLVLLCAGAGSAVVLAAASWMRG